MLSLLFGELVVMMRKMWCCSENWRASVAHHCTEVVRCSKSDQISSCLLKLYQHQNYIHKVKSTLFTMQIFTFHFIHGKIFPLRELGHENEDSVALERYQHMYYNLS